ncbi:MAG: hypothetical protein M1831_002851 [Alyxoria varia]|nr:MAG: hypothetical protein M1831_002851 [Alyxoria varia]
MASSVFLTPRHPLPVALERSLCRLSGAPILPTKARASRGSPFLRVPNCSLKDSCSRHLIAHSRGFISTTQEKRASGFVYKVAAAYSGKTNVFRRTNQNFGYDSATGIETWADVSSLTKNQKIPSGQDAFFAGPAGQGSAAAAFGVADGVGGYKDSGIDSADFAHGICKYMKQAAKSFPESGGRSDRLNPLQLLQTGYKRICSDRSVAGGGSTACVGVAEPDGVLSVANLGDSGFIQLRLNAVHYYSNPQTHAFNTPFQLAQVPPKILAQIQNFGGKSPFADMPADASLSTHDLQHGDVLIFATDGVWDNLTSQEVLDRVSSAMVSSGAWAAPEGSGVAVSKALSWLTDEKTMSEVEKDSMPLQTKLAVDITSMAKAASVDMKRDGPFARAVQQAYPEERYYGGKIDDICVLVVIAIDHGFA